MYLRRNRRVCDGMDKRVILERLDRFPYDRSEYWVVAGSAMVLHGIKAQTPDIDLGCSRTLADRLEADGYPYRRTDSGKRWFRFDDSIEIFEEWLCDSAVTVDGVRVVSIRGLIEMKQALGREKDLRDIERIRAFMKRTHPAGNQSDSKKE